MLDKSVGIGFPMLPLCSVEQRKNSIKFIEDCWKVMSNMYLALSAPGKPAGLEPNFLLSNHKIYRRGDENLGGINYADELKFLPR